MRSFQFGINVFSISLFILIFTTTGFAADPSLVAHWQLDGDATDSSGYGHHGTVYGNPNWVAGAVGSGAIQLDGVDDYIEIENYTGVTGSHSRTVTAWINADVSTDGTIVMWGDDSDAGGKWLFRINTDGKLRISASGGYAIATTDLRGTGWHHVAVVLADDGTVTTDDIQFYIDGMLDPASFVSSVAIDTTDIANVTVGATPLATLPFKGMIDDVRIYDRALTIIELADLAGILIFVPADYSTIQAAIDGSVAGDTIVVSPGTYVENINFNGKNIILTSTDPADPNIVAATVIDGNAAGSVVTFAGTETSACELRGFTITNGYTSSDGGGIYGGEYNTETLAMITRCTITGNTADGRGGGLYRCNGPITHCTITGNSAHSTSYGGGGLYRCRGPITHCTVTGNTTTGVRGDGGGLAGCDGAITNCTISGNTAFGGWADGGGLFVCEGQITGCIVWGNSAGNVGDQLEHCSTPTYSCIQDWTGGGVGNITIDPLFADSTNDDYHLKSQYGRWDPNILQWVTDVVTSWCIDAGDPTDLNWQNELWPHGGRVNMGAYGGTPEASMSANTVGNVADLDHDDEVGILDLELFCDDWLYNEHLLDTDLNLDGKVDIADFADFANQWLWGS